MFAAAKRRFVGAESSCVVACAWASADSGDVVAMIVLGISMREFCRKLLRSHRSYAARYRGNLVVAFPQRLKHSCLQASLARGAQITRGRVASDCYFAQRLWQTRVAPLNTLDD